MKRNEMKRRNEIKRSEVGVIFAWGLGLLEVSGG